MKPRRIPIPFQKFNRSVRTLLASLALGAVALAVTPGCSTLMPDHPKLVVSIPASAGAVLGAIAGIPAEIVCLPVTIPLDSKYPHLIPPLGNEDITASVIFAPAFPFSYVGSAILGDPFWLAFGWWGLPDDAPVELRSPKYLILPPNREVIEKVENYGNSDRSKEKDAGKKK